MACEHLAGALFRFGHAAKREFRRAPDDGGDAFAEEFVVVGQDDAAPIGDEFRRLRRNH